MVERKPEYPEPGDLVIATIETVTDYGAYAKLDEYGKRGLLHVSEISSSWIRNIRDFVRENQKMVLKVLRVDPEKGHVDLLIKARNQTGTHRKNQVVEERTQSRRSATRRSRKSWLVSRRGLPESWHRT